MEQQETCQAIWRYKTESKSPEIIFSALEHLDKQPRKEILLPKKKKNQPNQKHGGFFQEVGQGTNKIWFASYGITQLPSMANFFHDTVQKICLLMYHLWCVSESPKLRNWGF